MDFVFVSGTIAADRGAVLIIKVKKINSDIKIVVLAEEQTDKTRVLDYGAEEFLTKPISAESIIDKVNTPRKLEISKFTLSSINTQIHLYL